MIPRVAAKALQLLAREYPVVVVTGPRQSGKSTLVQAVFPRHPLVSLEDLDEREFARSDPRGFLARFPDGAVLDEVQRTPGLLNYLQGIVDRDTRPGRFILTGSQQFDLLAGVTQSLAGRAALLPLLPFTYGELRTDNLAPAKLEEWLWRGAYPPLYDRPIDAGRWYGNYVSSYLERDVRQLIGVRDLGTFQRFVRMVAARTGQLVNLSSLGADCGVTHNTAKAWLDVLQASHLVHLLPPYHRNFGKRLVKTPKLYFLDSGLAAWLLGISDAASLSVHASRGALFETWVLAELLKARYNAALPANVTFWRDRTGHEVDFLVEERGRVQAIEAKSGSTFAPDFLDGLKSWRKLAKGTAGDLTLVYGGDQAYLRDGITVAPWRRFGAGG